MSNIFLSLSLVNKAIRIKAKIKNFVLTNYCKFSHFVFNLKIYV